jgi:hypothetical protein
LTVKKRTYRTITGHHLDLAELDQAEGDFTERKLLFLGGPERPL